MTHDERENLLAIIPRLPDGVRRALALAAVVNGAFRGNAEERVKLDFGSAADKDEVTDFLLSLGSLIRQYDGKTIIYARDPGELPKAWDMTVKLLTEVMKTAKPEMQPHLLGQIEATRACADTLRRHLEVKDAAE